MVQHADLWTLPLCRHLRGGGTTSHEIHDVKQPAAYIKLPACRLCLQELEVGQMQKVWIQSQTTFASVAKNEDGHFCCKVGPGNGHLELCRSLAL